MKIAAAVLILALSACQGGIKRPAAPKDLIPRDSMVLILRDLVVLEAYVETRYQQVQNYHKVMTETGKQCLRGFRISPERFERSFIYYTTRQEELQGIYADVLDSLNREVSKAGVAIGIDANSADVLEVEPAGNSFFPGRR